MSSRYVFTLTLLLIVLLAGLVLWLAGDPNAAPTGRGLEFPGPASAPESPEASVSATEGRRAGHGRAVPETVEGIAIQAGVRVKGSGRLAGRVLERGTDRPLEGMRVELFDFPPAGAPFVGEITQLFGEARAWVGTGLPLATAGTAAGGDFRFDGVKPGTWYIQARGAYHVPDTVARTRVTSGGAAASEELLVNVYARPGGRVVGRVSKPDGEPARAAEVVLLPSITTLLDSVRTGNLCFLETVTDEQGDFVLSGVPEGPAYDVYALGAGFALSFVLDVPVVAGQDSRADIQGRQGGLVTGRVVSAEGAQGISGAHVACVPRGLRYLPFAPRVLLATRSRSDAEGRYTLRNVPPGDLDIVGIAPGHTAAIGPSVFVPEGGSAAAEDFELEVGAMVRGVVVDVEQRPLAGVRVTWEPIDLERAGFEGSIAPLVARVVNAVEFPVTGPDGRFEAGAFAGDPPHEIRFEKEGYAKLEHRYSPGGSAEDALNKGDGESAGEDELTIVLKSGGFIEGIVIDAEQAEPIPIFTVQSDQLLGTRDLPFSGPLGGNLVEADQGRFRIGPFEPGQVELSVDARGYLRSEVAELEVAAGETLRGVILRLYPGGIVRGRVVDSQGAPIAGAIVYPRYKERGETELPAEWQERRGTEDPAKDRTPKGLSSYIAQLGLAGTSSSASAADGSFELTGMEPGMQSVGAVHRDYSPGWSEVFQIAYGAPAATTEVVLQAGGAIFGTVTDRFDRPIPGSIVIAAAPYNMESEESQGDALYQGHTNEDGVYRIEHVAPGSYFMVVTRGDEALDPMSFLGALNFDMVLLQDGDELEHDIVDNSVGGTRLFGRVTAGGDEVGLGQITAMGFESGGLLGVDIKVARIREGGRYEFEGLAPGEYQLGIRSEGIRDQAKLRIDVPDVAEVQLDLALPEGRIAGRVLDADTGAPIQRAWVSAATDPGEQPAGFLGQIFGRESGTSRVRSDEQGAFAFEHLQAGDYDISVRSTRQADQHYAPGEALSFRLGSNQHIEDVELRLQAALELQVLVVDRDARAVSGARIACWIAGRTETLERATTSDEGRATVRGLAPGEYIVSVSHDDHAAQRREGVKLSRQAKEELRLTLEAGILVTVEILGGDGEPLAGASARLVALEGEEDPTAAERAVRNLFEGGGVSDARGRLELGLYLPGAYRLEAQRRSGNTASEIVQLKPGSASRELRIRLR